MVSAARTYQMLGNESLWQVAQQCKELLNKAEIPYGVCGGIAVCLHGYQRNTVDVDLIIQPENADQVKSLLEANGFRWDQDTNEFRTDEGFVVHFLTAGARAGRGAEVRIAPPEGDLNIEEIEGFSVVRLSRLIEMKIASGMCNLRRTHKDFADVVELIAIRRLDASFVCFLHKSVRPTFRELVRNANAGDGS